ncbi:MAG: endonuclease Q family protein, partial [Christensenellaceae bacterium]|nr:endonuclease Q family protein [Christensenellaceae bacterium]
MFIADFHIHSKYSRATSKNCVPEMLDLWARQKGLNLIGTGDFTHAAWREELRDKLVPAEEGLYALGKAFMQKGPFDSGAFEPR